MFRGIGLASLLAIAACSGVQNQPATDPASSLNETVFRCNVEPIFARQCSYSACHGIAGAAFRVYSPGKLRAPIMNPDGSTSPPMNIDQESAPLTDAEEHANFESASGFAFGLTSVADDFLLRKPLPSIFGGYEHKGGAIWSGTDDPQYVAILAWLSGTGACK